MLEVRAARSADEIRLVRALFREYADGLGVPLCFQGFAAELESLPGAYAEPAGCLLLAWLDGECAGCVGLRSLDEAHCSVGVTKLAIVSPGTCEMKRLYVPARFRGRGIGRALAGQVLKEAAAAGYRQICLDTLPSMTEAIAMYRSLGFEPVASYYDNPVPGALFFARDLPPGD